MEQHLNWLAVCLQAFQARGAGLGARLRPVEGPRGQHACMAMRGVQVQADMTTSDLRGYFRVDDKARKKLISLMRWRLTGGSLRKPPRFSNRLAPQRQASHSLVLGSFGLRNRYRIDSPGFLSFSRRIHALTAASRGSTSHFPNP